MRPAPSPKRRYVQLYLDLGQTNFTHTTCSVCGLVYAMGVQQDDKVHNTFHKAFVEGITFKGWKKERALQVAGRPDRKIVLVLPGDGEVHQRKVKEVAAVMEADLGLAEGWLLHKPCKVYMYIASSKVVGCLMVESISQALPTVLLPRDAAHDAGPQMAPAEELPAADVSNSRSRGDAFVSVGQVFAGQGGASAGGVAQGLLGSVREGGVGVNGANEGVNRPPVKEKGTRGGLNGLRVREDAANEGGKAPDVETNASSSGGNGPSVGMNAASKGVNGPRMLAVNAAADEGVIGSEEIAGGASEDVNAADDTAKGSVTGIKESEDRVWGTVKASETDTNETTGGARTVAGGERSLVGMQEHSRDEFQEQGQAAANRARDGAQPKAGPRGQAEALRGEVRRGVRFSKRCRAARAGRNELGEHGRIEAQGSSRGKTDDSGQLRELDGRMAGYGHHLQPTGTGELLRHTGRSGQSEISVGIRPLSSAGGAERRLDPVVGWLESMGQRREDDADGPAGEGEERPSDHVDHPQTAAETLPALVSGPEATPSATPVPASPEDQSADTPLLPPLSPLLGQPLLKVPNSVKPLYRGPASQQAAKTLKPLRILAKGTPNPPKREDAASISQEPSESPKARHIAGAREPPHIATISQRRSETLRAAGRPSLYSQLMSASSRKRVKSEKQASEGKELATAGVQHALVCRTEPVRAACGVRAIWVRKAERRKGVATALLEAMRSSFVTGCILDPSMCAFSQPTPDGRRLAANFCGTETFLVYH